MFLLPSILSSVLSLRVNGGEHVADIGPLRVKPGTGYSATYMEAIFTRHGVRHAHALRTRGVGTASWLAARVARP